MRGSGVLRSALGRSSRTPEGLEHECDLVGAFPRFFIFSLFFFPAAIIVAYMVQDRTTMAPE